MKLNDEKERESGEVYGRTVELYRNKLSYPGDLDLGSKSIWWAAPEGDHTGTQQIRCWGKRGLLVSFHLRQDIAIHVSNVLVVRLRESPAQTPWAVNRTPSHRPRELRVLAEIYPNLGRSRRRSGQKLTGCLGILERKR